MAAIRERKKADGTAVFHVQVRMSGFPARTASFRTRKAAKQWATTVEAEMIEGKHFRSPEARRRSISEAITRYTTDEIPKKRDGDMHRAYLPYWSKRLGTVKLAAVTPALLVQCRDELARGTYTRAKPESKRSTVKGAARRFKRRPGTVNRSLAALSHVFTIARREWHWMSHNPMDGVSKLPEGRGPARSLTDEERQALLAETAKDPTLHAFVVIALSTACRAGELQNLAWSDVDLKTGRVLFRKTKNDEPRTAWLQGAALELLKEHGKVRKLTGGPVFENASGRGRYNYDKKFKTAVAAAGLKKFRFHDTRHTAATYLAQDGATEQQLRVIGGWKSNVVSRYVHLASEDAKAAIGRLAEKITT
jgi:integrase